MTEWSPTTYLTSYLVIIVLTWVLNILLTVGIFHNQNFCSKKIKKKSKQIPTEISRSSAQLANYYFILSICLSNLISVTLNPPSFIVLYWFLSDIPSQNLKNVFCLVHCSLNTFLCNLAFLHVLCSSLDTFLRLKNPRLYLDSQRPQTTFLKISAPWIVTTIQSVCQFTISNQKSIIVRESLCMVNDGNFLILRSVISYAVPLIVCVILTILQIIYLKQLSSINFTNLQFLIRSYRFTSRNSKQVDDATDGNEVEGLNSSGEDNENDLSNVTVTETRPIQVEPSNATIESRILKHNCPKHGLISFPIPLQDFQQTIDRTAASSSFAIVQETNKPDANKSVSFEMPDVTNQTKQAMTTSTVSPENCSVSHKNAWLKMYKTEQLSIGINMVTCIISIGVWSPLMLSTLAYKLCDESPCTLQILRVRIKDFEWWAFSGGMVYPCIYFLIDSTIRKSIKAMFTSVENQQN